MSGAFVMSGEEHYNCISALHKSMRGSDQNASLYWLARMLEGGEDPLYVARRLVRFASEDIGECDERVPEPCVREGGEMADSYLVASSWLGRVGRGGKNVSGLCETGRRRRAEIRLYA